MASRVEKHLSRLAMPKSWQLPRKTTKWIVRPRPGSHKLEYGLPLSLVIRDILHLSKNMRETKKILNNKEVMVDGVIRKDPKFIVGIMDVISIPNIKSYYRVLLNSKGRLMIKQITAEESKLKPCKIANKTKVGKKTQLNLYDGKNILVEKDEFKTNDSIVIEIPSKKIKEHLKFEKGSIIYLIGGSHVGETGILENIKGNKITFKKGNEIFETANEYAFVIGKAISI